MNGKTFNAFDTNHKNKEKPNLSQFKQDYI